MAMIHSSAWMSWVDLLGIKLSMGLIYEFLRDRVCFYDEMTVKQP